MPSEITSGGKNNLNQKNTSHTPISDDLFNIRLIVVYFVGHVDTNFAQDGNYNELIYNLETFLILYYERLFRNQHEKYLFEVVC